MTKVFNLSTERHAPGSYPYLRQDGAAQTVRHRFLSVRSAATVWEISIERRIGKLDFEGSPVTACGDAGLQLLDMTATHAETAGGLPRHHGDPFDRMLIAQARLEHWTIVAADRTFRSYEVPIL